MRVRRLALLVAVGSALMAGGCVTIPSLEGNRIAISDVVERVKCDLADALPDPYKYPWMANGSPRLTSRSSSTSRQA